MARRSMFPGELRDRAARLVAEAMERGDDPSEFEAIRTIATKPTQVLIDFIDAHRQEAGVFRMSRSRC